MALRKLQTPCNRRFHAALRLYRVSTSRSPLPFDEHIAAWAASICVFLVQSILMVTWRGEYISPALRQYVKCGFQSTGGSTACKKTKSYLRISELDHQGIGFDHCFTTSPARHSSEVVGQASRGTCCILSSINTYCLVRLLYQRLHSRIQAGHHTSIQGLLVAFSTAGIWQNQGKLSVW